MTTNFVKETEKYWVFVNNNKYSKDKYTKEDAIETEATLVDCYDCIDSVMCHECNDCINCSYCDMCDDCVDCHNCFALDGGAGVCFYCDMCDDCVDGCVSFSAPTRSSQ